MDNRKFKLPFNRAVFIDGTWNQSKAMYGCLKGNSYSRISETLRYVNEYIMCSFSDLPCIVLQSRLSQFWRHQKKSPRWYLATIEAIHQLFIEIYDHCSEVGNCELSEPREFDNLLFFFRYMYYIIHTYYDHNSLLSYRRPLNL